MDFKKLKKYLKDERVVLGIGIIFILISFVDVMFFTDASMYSEMTVWGKASFIGTFCVMGWFSISMLVMPLINKLKRHFSK